LKKHLLPVIFKKKNSAVVADPSQQASEFFFDLEELEVSGSGYHSELGIRI
jgi:hypothetical protein